MRTLAMAAAATLLVTGCSAADGAGDESVLATTSIWGSVTSQIVDCAGSGSVRTLMPVGTDAHVYTPSSADVAAMVEAPLVVSNGLGLEGGLDSSLESAAADGARIFPVAEQLNPVPFPSGAQDPHVWLDLGRAAQGARLIGDQLADSTGDDAYRGCGQQVADDILATQQQLVATLDAVPAEDRILVTDHDSLRYFARAYGFTIAGVVIPGGSTTAEPSSAELSALVGTIESTGVPAVFSDQGESTTLIDTVAEEAGGVSVVPLYIESVGAPGSGADTYQTMMLANAAAIADALT